MKYMLDTNIWIYMIKQKPESVLENLREKASEGIAISSIAYAELRGGVENSMYPAENSDALERVLLIADILPFDRRAALEYGKIYAALRRKGTPIGPMDTLIAAHAKAQKLILVTNNAREFERVEGLAIENWAGRGPLV